jgi:hypothetical protein
LDHAPAHVHVQKAGGEAKFNLMPVELVKAEGMKLAEVTEAFTIACQHQSELLKAWNEIHG